MKQKSVMLFQLFLAIFASYAVLSDVPDQFCFIPLLCLACMFLLGKHQTASIKAENRKN